MKTLQFLLFSFFILGLTTSIQAQKADLSNETALTSETIDVYYFHFTKRCLTCNAVESETINALEKYYAEEMNTGKISFTSLNLDTKEGKKTADGLKISGQTLLIVKGETKVDLTSQGFMQARSNPEKLHAIIKTKIDELL